MRASVKEKNSYSESYFKKMGKQKVFAWIVFAIFAVYSVSLVFPFVWILGNSLKTEQSFVADFHGFPFDFYFTNYKNALLNTTVSGLNMLSMFGNSLLIVSVSTLLTLITSSCSAYVVAKFKFRGRNIIYSAVIFSLIVPIVGTLPSLLKVMKDFLHIHDTYFALFFIYSGGFGMNFLLLYGFFKNLSMGYAEAAYIDGAGDFRVFFTIMLPLAMPALTSVGVLTFIGLWNEYVLPRILLPSQPTIAVGLFDLAEQLRLSNNWTLMFATVVLALIPIIIVFLIFQKTIMTNTVAGGLKG